MKINPLNYTLSALLFPLLISAQKNAKEFETLKGKYNSKEFNYVVEAEKVNKKPQNYDWLDDLFNFLSGFEWNYIIYITIGAVILLIIYKLYQNGLIFNIKTENRITDENQHFDYIEKNLLTIDLWELINQAKTKQDYRLAIRYYHYQNTQNLGQKNYLKWDPKKTNQQISQEIKQENIKKQFEKNTRIFNQVWFGNFELNQEKFEEFEKQYQLMNQMI